MEVELITVKEETGSVNPPACCVCQEELPDLAGSPGQIPQCRACKSIILEPRDWLSDDQEVRAFLADRPYGCSFCSKRFKRASDRRDHERVHTGERPYGCGVCGKRFTQSSVLSGHMRIHTGERPFHCSVCLKSFNNGSNFRKHQRTHGQPYGHDGKAHTILPEKKQSQPTGRQDDGDQCQGKILRQNCHQGMKELRGSGTDRGHDLAVRQNSPHVNGLLGQDASHHSRRQYDDANSSKRMKTRQSTNYCGPNLDTKHRSGQTKAVDNKGPVGELGGNEGHRNEQNGHAFRLVKYVCRGNPTKGLKLRKAEESHAQGERKQQAVNHGGGLQLDGVGRGKGLLPMGGNGDHIHRLIQNGGVRGYDLDRTNKGYLRGLKLTGSKGTSADLKRGDTGGSPNSGLRQICCDSTIKLRQNVSHGGHTNGLSENGSGHFGVPRQNGGTSREEKGNFQATGNANCLVPKMSVRTCPEREGVLVWEVPDTETVRGRDERDECSPFARHPSSSPWEPGTSDPRSQHYEPSVSHQNHSLQVRFSSTVTPWGGESPTGFPAQSPESYPQHSQSVIDAKPFMCFACPKQFRRATDLKEHLRVHTGERPFGCTVCGKRFTQSSALATHRRLHTGEKPFECTVCHRRFNNSSNFAKHRRIHTQESARLGSKGTEKALWSAKAQ